MKNLILKNAQVSKFLVLLVFFFLSMHASGQSFSSAKVDAVFQAIINQKDLPVSGRVVPAPYSPIARTSVAPGKSYQESGYDCIVYTKNARFLTEHGIAVQAVFPDFVTAWATIDQLVEMSSMEEVRFIKSPEVLYPNNDVAVGNTGASLLHAGRLNNTVYKGKGVIVAVFDSGIDWDHPDFRDAADQTKSRILRIWDQTLTPIAGETSPAPFGYGVEYTQAHLNDELDGTPTGFVREQDVNGHGTHVAGTAAGNGMAVASRKYTGMAPESDIVIIKGGNGSFSSTNIINGIAYLQGLATSLGKPVVLNMSLGSQFGPHDGSTPQEAAIDNFTASAPGRVIVVSAGNDNGTNIHTQTIISAGATQNITFTVPSGSSGTDVFQYSAWANDNTNVTAVVTAPGGATATALAGQTVATPVVVGGGNFIINIQNTIDAGNSDRSINLYVTRSSGNPAGTWTLALTNNGASAITVDGWLNYKNAAYSGTTVTGGNSAFLCGSISSASSAITVASFVGRLGWFSPGNGALAYNPPATQDNISTFSSNGPRRDNVQKPDIAATGQAVISCLSSNIIPTSTNVVVAGLYQKNQGTSMASPVTAGAVALLLQASPAATASQIKSWITANANTDALTGSVPNFVWGSGRLDVFKAASAVFNCGPANRITYQYDDPYTSSQDASLALTTQRVAVQFSPNITGKLAGIFYHSVSDAGAGGTFNLTSFTAEIRTNNAGNPGTLLGTLNIPVANVAKFSWNYFDLSSLNIGVTSGTDYFVVIYAGASSTWGIRVDNTGIVDNRSLTSSNGGATWSNPGFDLRIRSVVYNNAQITTGAIASVNATDSRDISTSNQFLGNCALISQVTPSGASPVSGVVESRVWIEGAVPTHNSIPYVARHYQITPSTNAATATARVTLYFTQAEFTAFNSHPASVLDLPINGADPGNFKANLRIGKLSGSSNNGTGLAGTYNGSSTVIDPADADIIWNAAFSRWEVTFDVTGFSGFIVQTSTSPILPVFVEYFQGQKQGANNLLQWKANCNSGSAIFEIERSGNGADFIKIGSVSANDIRCQQPFDLTDVAPLSGKNYYRIKVIEGSGAIRYSSIILIQRNGLMTNSVYPTYLTKSGAIQVTYAASTKGSFSIFDVSGKIIFQKAIMYGSQGFDLPLNSSGTYFYQIRDDKEQTILNGKLVIQ